MPRGPSFVPVLHGLREARLAKALTQRELAEAAGVHPVTVSDLERGKSAGPKTMRKLAGVLDVEPVVLMRRPRE
jgi:transcriptional regulator with XRE-family HTH domain